MRRRAAIAEPPEPKPEKSRKLRAVRPVDEPEPEEDEPPVHESAIVTAMPVRRQLPVAAGPAFELPELDLLARAKGSNGVSLTKAQLTEVSRQLETVLDDFGVRGEIVDAKPGPVVTLFELEPAPGTRAARVIGLADDIARSLVRAVGPRRRRPRPQRHRHRAAQRAARHRLPARDPRERRLPRQCRPPGSGARQGHQRPARSSSTSPGCRIC